MYTLEIFMRQLATCRSRKDRAGKNDPRSPLVRCVHHMFGNGSLCSYPLT